MRRPFPVLAALLTAVLAFLLPAAALGAEPPNRNDPCGSAGRDTCGTTGVGFYKSYKYGIRWFGDFRGAVAGEAQTFCIDLRFWYPGKGYRYAEVDGSQELRNRDGKVIPVSSKQKMSYAMWAYGRTGNASQQAAVMLYVHSLMGDGAPGEIDPDAIGVRGLYDRIERDARRYRGPYRIEATVPDGLTVAKQSRGTVKVLSATGVALPNVDITLAAPGATGLPRKVTTNASGVAAFTFTPSDAAGVDLTIQTEKLASTLPKIFKPTQKAAARNGQRLAAAGSQQLTATVQRDVAQGRVKITTQASAAKLLVGEAARDKVTVSGLAPGAGAPIGFAVHGPFRSSAEVRCDGTPAFQGTLSGRGSGTFTSPTFTPAKAGIYTFQLSFPGTDNYAAVTTPCGVPAETFTAEVQPQVRTVVSAASLRPGATISDTLTVSGLVGEPVTVNAALYGPYPAPGAITCQGTPVWTGTVSAPADGDYVTEPVTLQTPGYYTYVESIEASGFVRATATKCADAAETTVVVGTPQVVTQVSAQTTRPGSKITDTVKVTGLGVVTAQVQVELWGPFPTKEAIACTGKPFATQTLTVNGDGTYTTPPVTIDRAGYFTYRESMAGSAANDAASTACGEAAETTFARAVPAVTTIVSNQAVRPGSAIFDRIRLTGLGKTPVTVRVELFGPFSTRAAIGCTGTPFWRGEVEAAGDGEVRSAPVRVVRAGFYTYRERIAETTTVGGAETDCAEVAETSLGTPQVVTGRGDRSAFVRSPEAGGATPVRVKMATQGIDAPVLPVGIDLATGTLGVPTDIRRTGWWRDGGIPGQKAGTVLIGGHVDSAQRGAGAFFRVKNARAGERVQVVTDDGRTVTYKVVSVRSYAKTALPTGLWTKSGPARLVLVTCGGPFIASEGHYRDNIVLTAVPA